MSDSDALLAGIVANPGEALRWLILADWLDDHQQPDRAEVLRLHRMLLDTSCEPESHPDRAGWHRRMMELLRSGVEPCVPRRTLTLPGGVELRMAFVPPGSFRMGSPAAESGRQADEAARVVTLTRGYWFGVSPVTQGQFQAVVGRNPSSHRGETLPVEQVNWDDATAFCAAVREATGVDARLPTEAEWEYAARGGTTTPFHWGLESNDTRANFNEEDPWGTPSPVGRYARISPHPWGLVDLHGNVAEWCADWYAETPDPVAVDPVGPDGGSDRSGRGGCWGFEARDCRSAARGYYPPRRRSLCIGFRLAAGLSGE